MPSQLLVHLALFSGQAVNGGGSVVAKLGFPSVNPVTFAFFREACASPILLALARSHDGPLKFGGRTAVPLLALATSALFFGQFLYTVGLKVSNPVFGAAWQPSQPVLTLALARMLGWEELNAPKVLGVVCTLAGGAYMTFMAPEVDGASVGDSSMLQEVFANMMFFGNCLATAVFVLAMRRVTSQIPPFTALAIIYTNVTVLLLVLALVVSSMPALQEFFCPDCNGDFWAFPSEAILALAYWVLGPSVFSFMCLTFGTRHAREPSHCLIYSTMQPVVASLLAAFLVSTGWNERHPEDALERLTLGHLVGAALIMLGIACVAIGTHKQGRYLQLGVNRKLAEALLLES